MLIFTAFGGAAVMSQTPIDKQQSKCCKWDLTGRPAATLWLFGCWVSWKPSGGDGKFTVAWVASQTVADGGNLAAASSAKTSVSWHACSKLDKWGIGGFFFKLLIKPEMIRYPSSRWEMWATVIFFPDATQIFFSPSADVTRIKVKGDVALSANRWYSYTRLYLALGLFLSPCGVKSCRHTFQQQLRAKFVRRFHCIVEENIPGNS